MMARCSTWVRLNAFNRPSCLFCLLIIGCLAVAVGGAPAQPPGDADERSAVLQQLVRELRQERLAYYEQKARDEADIKQAQEDARLLQAQINALRSQQADLDQQTVSLQAETQSLTEQLQRRDALDRMVTEEITALVPAQAQAIEKGIPYKQSERLARLQACISDPNESTVSAAGRLSQLWTYVQQELRMARSSETYTDRAPQPDGSVPYARYLRVGQRILAYSTEDGRTTAVWLRGPQGDHWQALPDAQEEEVTRAIEILDGRRAPTLVTLPVTVQAAKSPEDQP